MASRSRPDARTTRTAGTTCCRSKLTLFCHLDGPLSKLRLRDFAIDFTAIDQFIMLADIYNAALIQNDDLIKQQMSLAIKRKDEEIEAYNKQLKKAKNKNVALGTTTTVAVIGIILLAIL
jgi:hypothetical protein